VAAEVKSRGGLSVADAWIASLALLHDAELVHKDPEFDAVEGLRAHRLPD
jgi:predicted nucleic acid-binding protein